MKIVYVTTEYPEITANYGGIAVAFKNEVDALRQRGHNVEVILIASNFLHNVKIHPYIFIFHFPTKGKMKGLRGRIKLTKFLNRRYDKNTIIVTSDFGGILPFRIKPFKITQLHGSVTLYLFHQKKKVKKLLFLLEFFNIFNSDKIRAVSESVLNDSRKIFPLIKKIPATIIPNGIKGFDNAVDEHETSHENKTNVIFIGKLSERKGVEFLGTIINRIHELLPKVKFTLIGHDEIKNGRSNKNALLNKLKFPELVTFYDRIANNQMGQYLRKSDVLILPSKTEALPIVVIEAFSCNVPVVAFNVGGLSELIDDGINGFLIQPFDIDLFIAKLHAILTQKSGKLNMGEEAYLKYIRKFKIETCINRLETFYSEL